MPRLAALAAFLLFLPAGCSSNPKPGEGAGGATRADEMREVGGVVAAHTTKGRKAAPTPAELTAYEPAFPLGVKMVRSGEVVAVWGAKPTDEGAVAAGQGGTDVIAYEKKAPTAGGWVLLQNGTVKEMTAAEFAAAPKAK